MYFAIIVMPIINGFEIAATGESKVATAESIIISCAAERHRMFVTGDHNEKLLSDNAQTGRVNNDAVIEIMNVVHTVDTIFAILLYFNFLCILFANSLMSFENTIIPRVAENESCKDMLITAKGLIIRISETARNRELSESE